MVRVDEGNDDGDSQAQISALLILVVLTAFVILFLFIVKEIRNELLNDTRDIQSITMAKSPTLKSSLFSKEGSPKASDVQIKDNTVRGSSMDGSML